MIGSLRTLLLHAALLAACGGGQQPAPEPPSPAAGGPLRVDVYLTRRVKAAGAEMPVGKGEVIQTGDSVQLMVTPSRDAYIYVVQLFPDKTLGTLWPPREAGHVRYPGGQTLAIPGDAGTIIVDPPEGEEILYVIGSVDPLEQADKAAAAFVATGHQGGKLSDAEAALQKVEAAAATDAGAGTAGDAGAAGPDQGEAAAGGQGSASPPGQTRPKSRPAGGGGGGRASPRIGTGNTYEGRARSFTLLPKKGTRADADDSGVIIIAYPLAHQP